jgi:hypothetical protein
MDYEAPSRKVPRPENGTKNRVPLLPPGSHGPSRRARSLSRGKGLPKDDKSYSSGYVSRGSRKPRKSDDVDIGDDKSISTGKLSRVSRAARGYDDDSAIASAVGTKKSTFSNYQIKPFPESSERPRGIHKKDGSRSTGYDVNLRDDEVSVSSDELDAVSSDEVDVRIQDGLEDLWKDINQLYPISLEDIGTKFADLNETKVTSKFFNRRDEMVKIKYYDPPKELEKLLSVIRNESSYDVEKVKVGSNSRAPLPENSTGRRVNACGALRALSKNAKNRLRLGRTKDVIPSLLSVLRDDSSSSEEKARCSSTFMYLAVPKQNCEAIFLADPTVLSTLRKGMLDDDWRVRYNCCFSLFLLSKSDDIRLEIINDDDISKALESLIGVNIDSANTNLDDDEMSVDGSLSQRFANLGSPSGIRQQGAPESDEEVKRGCRLSALKIFLAISKIQYGSTKVAANDSLVNILATISGTMSADENVLCMAIFTNVSRNLGNIEKLLGIPNLLDAMSRGLSSKSSECRKCAIFALQNLSCNFRFRHSIGKSQNVLLSLVPQILNVNDTVADDVQLAAVHILRNLSVEPANVPVMMSTPGLTAGLMKLAIDNSKEVVQYI